MGMVKTRSMDPLGEKGGSTLDLHSCHTRAGRGTTPEFRVSSPQVFLGSIGCCPRRWLFHETLVKQSGSKDRAATAVASSLSFVTTDTAAKVKMSVCSPVN